MKSILNAIHLAICVGAVGGTSLAAQTPGLPDHVRASIQARVDHEYNVGIVVGIVNPHGRQYFSYGRVTKSGTQSPDESTVFEIGSITKVFTSILLADMVVRGEADLDDSIDRYLPGSVRVPTRNGRSITLVDLATQTSGLPRMPDNFAPADPGNPYADYSVEQLYEFLSRHELRRDIGSQYEYSNYGVGLLGHVLALRSGMSYEDLVRQRIADALDMPDTRITFTPSMDGRIATGHRGPLEVSHWDIPTLAGAGALRSTARDMLNFLAANLGLEENDLHDAMKVTHEPRHEAGSPRMRIGLGWHMRSGDRDVVWHNGGTGGFRAFAGFVQDAQTGVVVLTNSGQSADDIGFHLLDASFPLQEIRVPVSVDRAVLERYVGRYELRPGTLFDVGLENDHLTVQLTGQPRFPLYAESETKFFVTVVDAQVTFQRNEAGTVTSLVLHQGGTDQTATRLEPGDQPSPAREEVEVAPEVLARYVGEYQLAPGVLFDVTLENGQLMVMLTGQPSFPVYPESETRFFYTVVDAQITFVVDAAGEVTSLILHQGGLDQTAAKLP